MLSLPLRVLLLILISALTHSIACAETVPAGTVLEIRLQQPLSSYSTREGTKITGVLISPVNEEGRILLPIGTTIEGAVADIHKVGIGMVHETALIELRFDHLVLANGYTIPVQCRITEVENARESVDKEGRIHGIRSTSTLSHRTSGVMNSFAFGDPIAAIFATAGSAAVLRFSEPEISFPEGTEMLAELTAPLDLPGSVAQTIPPIARTGAEKDELREIVRDLPFRTYTDVSHIPSDMTNLVFIGSSDALERAFAASGWVRSDPLTSETAYRTVRSIAENQGYRAAPMSTLLLDGKQPDYTYAKTLDTFSQRHHLRIWKTDQMWHGQTIFTSSSTHDIGIGFSKSNKTFIHLIDTHIDNERAKVVNDMIYTGCVSSVQLVTRPWIPKDAKNGTGEPLITDGRIAILRLNDCRAPSEAENLHSVTLPVHGNGFDRVTRQTVLTLKNNILRDNVGVMGYSGIHTLTSRKKTGPRPVREMEVAGNEYTLEENGSRRTAYDFASLVNPPPNKKKAPHVADWTPPTIELGIRGGWRGYAGGNGGAIAYLFQSVSDPDQNYFLVAGNTLDNGWSLGGSITINAHKYLSHEFSYDHSFTTFTLAFVTVDNDSTSELLKDDFEFDPSGLQTSQFTYNLLINLRPKTSRWRPYFAVGPTLQLMHLDEAPIKKAPNWFKLGLSNIGLITAAYDFGSTPALEGGGIFQAGLNYGGGVRYRLTPRWMARVDWRETLTSQPDFWSKSKNDLFGDTSQDEFQVALTLGPVLEGAMRQEHVTGGISFTF
jgi:opacity protein-like surface antigen